MVKKINYTWRIKHAHVVYGNPLSPVAVCFVYPGKYPDRGRDFSSEDRKLYERYMEYCRECVRLGAAVAGLQNTELGIVYVLRTCFENPNIRYLVVVGRDHGHKIMTMYKQLRAIQQGASPLFMEPLSKYVSKDFAHRFVKKVKVICIETDDPDAVFKKVAHIITACYQEPENKVTITIDGIKYELYDPGAYEDSTSPDVNVKGRVFISSNIAVVEAETIDEAWEIVAELVERYGTEVEDVRGKRKYLTMPLVVTVKPAFRDSSLEHAILNESTKLILSPEKGRYNAYSYGNRIFRYFGVDQLEVAVERLAKGEVTRAYISLFDTVNDTKVDDIPCLVAIQLYWSVPYRVVSLVAYFRSWDVGRAFPWNMGMLLVLLKEAVARVKKVLGKEVDCGAITVITPAGHVYI